MLIIIINKIIIIIKIMIIIIKTTIKININSIIMIKIIITINKINKIIEIIKIKIMEINIKIIKLVKNNNFFKKIKIFLTNHKDKLKIFKINKFSLALIKFKIINSYKIIVIINH
jgi:hypothetical protein